MSYKQPVPSQPLIRPPDLKTSRSQLQLALTCYLFSRLANNNVELHALQHSHFLKSPKHSENSKLRHHKDKSSQPRSQEWGYTANTANSSLVIRLISPSIMSVKLKMKRHKFLPINWRNPIRNRQAQESSVLKKE